ncbi:hypothetical protein ACIP4T_17480 [Streptomyces massasporeus]|uniref:hypothetical protein n=1 Tax=Streptomyces massasporeus TaxID=67324 RepID=UPI003691458B
MAHFHVPGDLPRTIHEPSAQPLTELRNLVGALRTPGGPDAQGDRGPDRPT